MLNHRTPYTCMCDRCIELAVAFGDKMAYRAVATRTHDDAKAKRRSRIEAAARAAREHGEART